MKRVAKALLSISLLFVLLTNASAKLFVPDSEPWAVWDEADESSKAVINHGPWQVLLNRYLITDADDGINRFNYAAFADDDRELLEGYLLILGKTDPRTFSRAEQLAYWINLYNAVTVKVVLDNYPVESIRKIHGGWLNTGPWDKPLVNVLGKKLTLNDIEHRILRPIWRDPRIHYVVNCASLGCPDLAATAFTGSNAEEMLDASAKAFINHPRGVNFTNGRLRLSSIFDWYDSDFGANKTERLAHLAAYAKPELASKLEEYRGGIKYDYDWRLNEP